MAFMDIFRKNETQPTEAQTLAEEFSGDTLAEVSLSEELPTDVVDAIAENFDEDHLGEVDLNEVPRALGCNIGVREVTIPGLGAEMSDEEFVFPDTVVCSMGNDNEEEEE